MSKGLEMVSAMIDGANKYEKETGDKNPSVYFSKSNLLVIEKSLKALEIIKEKDVDIDYFLFWSKQRNLGKVEDYNVLLKHKNGRCQRLPLTEEEFKLLKEVLE